MSSNQLNSIIRILKWKGNTSLSLMYISQVIDPTNPLNVINTTTLESIQSFKGRYKSNEIDNAAIRKTDIKLYVDPTTISSVPTVSDKVTDGLLVYNIQSINKWQDNETIVLYVFQLRE